MLACEVEVARQGRRDYRAAAPVELSTVLLWRTAAMMSTNSLCTTTQPRSRVYSRQRWPTATTPPPPAQAALSSRSRPESCLTTKRWASVEKLRCCLVLVHGAGGADTNFALASALRGVRILSGCGAVSFLPDTWRCGSCQEPPDNIVTKDASSGLELRIAKHFSLGTTRSSMATAVHGHTAFRMDYTRVNGTPIVTRSGNFSDRHQNAALLVLPCAQGAATFPNNLFSAFLVTKLNLITYRRAFMNISCRPYRAATKHPWRLTSSSRAYKSTRCSLGRGFKARQTHRQHETARAVASNDGTALIDKCCRRARTSGLLVEGPTARLSAFERGVELPLRTGGTFLCTFSTALCGSKGLQTGGEALVWNSYCASLPNQSHRETAPPGCG
ncbi:hypothetical protein ON010_g6101 [Phytophthora cinnamomi]|nr:hypothetical protein ON010_g6101 [Phytophthora cinnamomi]